MLVLKDIGKALVIPKWQQVDLEEMRSLENNGTWQLVDSPRGKKPVDYKWLYTINGSTKRYKARLVAKSFTQAYGIDYQETFAPVVNLNTIKVLVPCSQLELIFAAIRWQIFFSKWWIKGRSWYGLAFGFWKKIWKWKSV